MTWGNFPFMVPQPSVLQHGPVSHFEGQAADALGEIGNVAGWLPEYCVWHLQWFSHC
jgi:hypothetical protein